MGSFSARRTLELFGSSLDETKIVGPGFPEFSRSEKDGRKLKSWSTSELTKVGEQIGFLKRPLVPTAISVFVSKGGVLKTTLTLNLARMAALHNIKTVVVGLDMQGDITGALSQDSLETENFETALSTLNEIKGLADVFSGAVNLHDVLLSTDIPTLKYIAETPELVALDQSLINKNRREFWLKEKIVEPLKKDFDLIIMDCSPNWNRLITNALVASDVLLSPLECKINNFRNFQVFRGLIAEFSEEMGHSFYHAFVATKLNSQRKLSRDIFSWYLQNLDTCLQTPMRESLTGEEATALRLSLPEYAPSAPASQEIRTLLTELWSVLPQTKRTKMKSRQEHGISVTV